MPTAEPIETADVLICGSGCAGSLLAWILARHGLDVVLVDRGCHPRFAIGESSTPLADFLLEKLADDFDLPELRPLARWGSWTKTYPHLRAGKKRGFSYYGHTRGLPHADDQQHAQSLLVAASTDDEVSDTHWMRADVDQWLCQQAVASGTRLYEDTTIDTFERRSEGWLVEGRQTDQPRRWQAGWIVDATGTGGLVPRVEKVQRIDDQLLTQTGSIFGHFTGVRPMPEWLQQHGVSCRDDCFHSDDAAQHHVLTDGWIWMLRFDCGITSVGITRPTTVWQSEGVSPEGLQAAWHNQLASYPTVADIMAEAKLVGPCAPGTEIAQLGWMPRISRLWEQAAGPQWLALPSTVGVIDPLHSTGIAHALSGVLRAAQILLCQSTDRQHTMLEAYRSDVVSEVRWIDRLVSTCYAGLPDFELFAAACVFYFMAAHTCEEELRDTGELRHGFLGFKRSQWQELVSSTAAQLKGRQAHASAASRRSFLDELRLRIEPWNKVGFLDPECRNRFGRAATKSLL